MPPVHTPQDRSRAPLVVAIAVAVALVVAGGAWLATRGGGSTDDLAGAEPRTSVPATVLGRGEIPGGFTWLLEARRDGSVCTTFTVTPGPPRDERCNRRPGPRAIDNTSTSSIRTGDRTVYVTLGQVSDRTERIRVASEGMPSWEVATLGGNSGLDMRFFVVHTTSNVAFTYTALAADGSELGRVEQPVFAPPR